MKRHLLPLLAAVLVFGLPAQVLAIGTLAETAITNTASVDYNIGATPVTQLSNTVTISVGEILDLTLTWQDTPNVLVQTGDTGQMLTFLLTNTGNFSETFNLSLNNLVNIGDNFNPITETIYLDSNGNGAYDGGVDTLYNAGVNDPTLAADGTITLFIFNAIPLPPIDNDTGISRLTATAATGSGPPGTPYALAGGTGTVTAVVGLSGGTVSTNGIYEVNGFDLLITKSAVVTGPPGIGGDQPLPGATITYTITVTITGTGSATGVTITDTIDTDVVYAAGTLALDAGGLSDIADADDGEVVAGVVTVRLGDITLPPPVPVHIITFDVTIP